MTLSYACFKMLMKVLTPTLYRTCIQGDLQVVFLSLASHAKPGSKTRLVNRLGVGVRRSVLDERAARFSTSRAGRPSAGPFLDDLLDRLNRTRDLGQPFLRLLLLPPDPCQFFQQVVFFSRQAVHLQQAAALGHWPWSGIQAVNSFDITDPSDN